MACLRSVALSILVLPLIAGAQPARPATLESIHLNSSDLASQIRFWTAVLPCGPAEKSVLCDRMTIFINEKTPTGPSVGTTINHIGFWVPSLEPYFGTLSQAGYKYTRLATGNQIMIDGPDGARVELTSDPSSSAPIRFHHLHFYTPAPKDMQAWYARIFGAMPGRRAQWDAGDLPGANLTYTQSNGPVAPTAGRAIDGVTFSVEDTQATAQHLRSSGVQVREMQFTNGPHHTAQYASFTDPWGASITLTQSSK